MNVYILKIHVYVQILLVLDVVLNFISLISLSYSMILMESTSVVV